MSTPAGSAVGTGTFPNVRKYRLSHPSAVDRHRVASKLWLPRDQSGGHHLDTTGLRRNVAMQSGVSRTRHWNYCERSLGDILTDLSGNRRKIVSHFSEIDRKIFGFSFSKIDAKSIATMICDPRSSSGVGLIVTSNTDHIVNLRRNVEFANAYKWAAVIVCDGFPIQYYARLRGIQVERVTGCDIMIELMSIAGSGQRLFFIVDSDPTATALKEWGEVHRVAVETAVPHYGFEDNIEESNRLLDQITRTSYYDFGHGSWGAQIRSMGVASSV